MSKITIRGGPTAHTMRVFAGDTEITGMTRIAIDPIEVGGVVTAQITVRVDELYLDLDGITLLKEPTQ